MKDQISRRGFLRDAAAAGLLLGAASLPASAPAQDKEKKEIGRASCRERV